MANINLLPWREELRQARRKEFLQLMGGVLVLASVVVLAWNQWVRGSIEWQTARNELLTRDIAVLDQQIKEISELKQRRTQMLERVAAIQGLQGNRGDIVRVLDQFVRATPAGVFFVAFSRHADAFQLIGFAESNNRISTLMRQLDAADKFQEPTLTKVEADPLLGDQGSRFEMQMKLTAPPATDLAGAP